MEKTRVTRHCGRAGYARHNDRDFDIDTAEHIDKDRTCENKYWHCYNNDMPNLTFVEAEKKYYADHYAQSLNAKNERYIKSRHRERVKTIDDIYMSDKTKPIETIYQTGNKNNDGAGIDGEELISIYVTYEKKVHAWNKTHGQHYHVLSVSLHMDETTPHIHERAVWDIQTADGLLLAQDKALEAAGVSLPDPTKPRSRHNNRKMTIDKLFRSFWIEACQEHGLSIEEDPVPGQRHKSKETYIDEQLARKLDDTRAAQEAIRAAITKINRLRAQQVDLEAKNAKLAQQSQQEYDRLFDISFDAEYLQGHKTLIALLQEYYPHIWSELEQDLELRAIDVKTISSDPPERLDKINDALDNILDGLPSMDTLYPIRHERHDIDYDR